MLTSPGPPDDYLPSATLAMLALRAEMLARLRAFFHGRGFMEVDTPILSADTVVDRHLAAFATEMPVAPHRPPRTFWLHTSPEFHMKRLLAAGATAIYQVAHVFRQDEIGPLHNPEFTMVEWYRTGDTPEQGMALLDDLAETMLGRGPAERVTYRAAFEQHVGLDPLTATTDALVARCHELQLAVPQGFAPDDRDTWLDFLLTECVQTHLGRTRPTILHDYPASQAMLAQVRHDDPPVAERFELYVDGIELANGYHELLDPAELRRRNRAVNARRLADGNAPLPEESRLLRAMDGGLPPSVGVALGFDRLAMLAAGASSLSDILAFPIDRA
ncbi:MAG: EF-P lysine aminoacylase EpmA [Patescibacteria group bacterium]|nr:EF-P lysine aminoacylase EpmA [Patescibacteria group bacterium]